MGDLDRKVFCRTLPPEIQEMIITKRQLSVARLCESAKTSTRKTPTYGTASVLVQLDAIIEQLREISVGLREIKSICERLHPSVQTQV